MSRLIRSATWLFGLLAAHVGIGAILHFSILPEAVRLPDDRPKSGLEVALPGGSAFLYRVTSVESDGELFEADWIGDPGAAIPSHTHPSQAVTLTVREGLLQLVLNGEERALGRGDSVKIAAGVEHQWSNASAVMTRALFQLRPAGNADFVFEQIDRAFHGDAGRLATAVQTIVLIGTHGEHTAWPVEVLRFIVAPTARLFGIRSYYPPTETAR